MAANFVMDNMPSSERLGHPDHHHDLLASEQAATCCHLSIADFDHEFEILGWALDAGVHCRAAADASEGAISGRQAAAGSSSRRVAGGPGGPLAGATRKAPEVDGAAAGHLTPRVKKARSSGVNLSDTAELFIHRAWPVSLGLTMDSILKPYAQM